jgi:hypothetical protein
VIGKSICDYRLGKAEHGPSRAQAPQGANIRRRNAANMTSNLRKTLIRTDSVTYGWRALRDILYLVERQILERNLGGGRGTSYSLATPDRAEAVVSTSTLS